METKEQLLKKCGKLVREYVEAYEAIPNSLPRLQVLPGGKDINESYIPTKESMSKYANAVSRFEKAFHAYNEAIEKLRKVQEGYSICGCRDFGVEATEGRQSVKLLVRLGLNMRFIQRISTGT